MRRVLLAAALFFLAAPAHAAEAPALGSDDRVLVVAPHPDDEALGAAGLIQRAERSGAAVRVLYLTHGDDNEVSSIFYFKKPLVTKWDFIRIGRIREKEAETAMGLIGAKPADLVFLGYPDGGLLPIWRKHWSSAKPYKNLLTEIDKVPYEHDSTYGTPYKGENLLGDVRKTIASFRPTRVFVTVPFDRHPDHRAAYLFTRLALLDEGSPAPLFGYIVHARRWPRPRAYKPAEALAPPASGVPEGKPDWVLFPLTADETAAKKDVISKYESQMTYTRKYLLSFVRTNEIFLPLVDERPASGAPAEAKTGPGGRPAGKGRDRRSPPRLEYFLSAGELWIDLRFDGSVDEMGGMGVELYPWRKDRPFGEMPKLTLRFFGRRFSASDALGRIKSEGLYFRTSPGRYQIRVPLALLGDPDRLFASASTAKREWTPDFDSWKLLDLEPA